MVHARYKDVVDALAADIRAGKIPPGTRLPTHRELAAREGLALVTATRVYAELAAMGLVSGEAGRGTFVRETSLSPRDDIERRAFAEDVVDLNFNYPSMPEQTDLLRTALRGLASSGDLEALLRYQSHGGRPHERASVALHLERRGLEVPANQVMIVSGAQHGLAIAALAVLQPGDVVAVDALTYPGFKVLAQAQRLELVPIPAAADGPDLDALAQLCIDAANSRGLHDANAAQPAGVGHPTAVPSTVGGDRPRARTCHHRGRRVCVPGGTAADSASSARAGVDNLCLRVCPRTWLPAYASDSS